MDILWIPDPHNNRCGSAKLTKYKNDKKNFLYSFVRFFMDPDFLYRIRIFLPIRIRKKSDTDPDLRIRNTGPSFMLMRPPKLNSPAT